MPREYREKKKKKKKKEKKLPNVMFYLTDVNSVMYYNECWIQKEYGCLVVNSHMYINFSKCNILNFKICNDNTSSATFFILVLMSVSSIFLLLS